MSFFSSPLKDIDNEIHKAINLELDRQQNQIELIASENIVSKAVLEAQGSIMTNKYAEGYASSRYYGGCEFVDIAEDLAIKRLQKLYKCEYANVQPHSGAQANGAVMLALIKPGDTILGMSLDAGGHLTHGSAPSMSGKWFNAIQYGLEDNGLIDYDEVEKLANEHKPKMLIGGFSAYSQIIDWERMAKIAKSIGAYFHVDMAHVSGLVAAGVYPNPVPHADVVTSTTHKTLRGPRGGIIICKSNPDLEKKFNSLVFPGTQGGPLMHVIAAKAVAFKEALEPEFKEYMQQVVTNANVLAQTMMNRGFEVVSGGTKNHLMLVSLVKQGLTGKAADAALHSANITVNKNSVPNDPQSPFVTSGIRLGTPAITTRGFKENETKILGNLICDVLDNMDNEAEIKKIKEKVLNLCSQFPVYSSSKQAVA